MISALLSLGEEKPLATSGFLSGYLRYVETNLGPFYWHGLTLIPAWISNHIHPKVWAEITYPFLNFNSVTVEVWEWISNLIPHFTGHVITYPCWD